MLVPDIQILDLYLQHHPAGTQPFTALRFARAVEALVNETREPVGWAVFQGDELLFLHKDKAQAEDWLNRGVSGRTLNPVYL